MGNGWEKDFDDMFLWDTVNEGPSQKKKGRRFPGALPFSKQSIQYNQRGCRKANGIVERGTSIH